MNFVSNIIWNSVEGFVEAGTRTAGGYAGDALLKAGDLIEASGRSIGNGIQRTASGYGNKISSGASTATVPRSSNGIKRSHSSPASSKAGTAGRLTSKVSVGASKYPSGKAVMGGGGGVKHTASATKSIVGGAQKTIGGVPKTTMNTTPLPKAYPNNAPYGTTTKPSVARIGKGVPQNKVSSLPKPYPGTSSFPTANNTTDKRTAVRPGGAPKPLKTNTAAGVKTSLAGKTPYPGTNTLPGQASKTPVRPHKYKPMERMKPQVEKGKMQHFAV